MRRAKGGGPVQPRQKARKRALRGIGIGQDGQAQPGKPRGIAIGADRQTIHLRLQPFHGMGDQAAPGERQHGLVGPAHAAALPAGQNHPEYPHACPFPSSCNGLSPSLRKVKREAR